MKILLKFALSGTRPQYEDHPMRIQLTPNDMFSIFTNHPLKQGPNIDINLDKAIMMWAYRNFLI